MESSARIIISTPTLESQRVQDGQSCVSVDVALSLRATNTFPAAKGLDGILVVSPNYLHTDSLESHVILDLASKGLDGIVSPNSRHTDSLESQRGFRRTKSCEC